MSSFPPLLFRQCFHAVCFLGTGSTPDGKWGKCTWRKSGNREGGKELTERKGERESIQESNHDECCIGEGFKKQRINEQETAKKEKIKKDYFLGNVKEKTCGKYDIEE